MGGVRARSFGELTMDMLQQIVARKRREVARRLPRAAAWSGAAHVPDRAEAAYAALARGGGPVPRAIAEVKFRSPSAGRIRARPPGEGCRVARAYAAAGAAAVSVLCDYPGFGSSPLELRRVAAAVNVPVLFKEFVLHPVQLDLARIMGAHMVLLLVRALAPAELEDLATQAVARGLAPVVEAADADELELALATGARIIGINARDLRTFRVDPERAKQLVDRIPADRIGVYMSGVGSAEDVKSVADTRADAMLIGESLMRAADPGAKLAQLLG